LTLEVGEPRALRRGEVLIEVSGSTGGLIVSLAVLRGARVLATAGPAS